MRLSKEVVAVHESGHVIMILNTPLCNFIKSVKIFHENEAWYGEVSMNDWSRKSVDPHSIYEFAKGLAGPMTQIKFFPDSIPKELIRLIEENGGLLKATKKMVEDKINIETNWWPDIHSWIGLCQRYPHCGSGFLQVESEINRFLESNFGLKQIQEMTECLLSNLKLEREEILCFSKKHPFVFSFPPRLK